MRSFRYQKQSGFTLIELIIVIVIVGILAAVAIPKFVSLSSDAQTAATQGVAGALASASSTNFALRGGLGATAGSAIANCNAVANALQGGLPNAEYSVNDAALGNGVTLICTLFGPGSATATFVGHGIT